VVVAELVEQGFLTKEMAKRKQVYRRSAKQGLPDLARYRNQHGVRTAGLDAMVAYSGGGGCAMQTLRVHLGDKTAEACGRCDHCTGEALQLNSEGDAEQWLASRPVIVPGYRKSLRQGRALFDSGRRSQRFLDFMRSRTSESADAAMVADLTALAASIGPGHTVVPLPTGTWAARDEVAAALGMPVWRGLCWRDQPEERQGRLLNNNQRMANVKARMMVSEGPPTGPLLLLDDYTGSGATLREAARALEKAGHRGPRVPLTVAKVRWRLGRPGIV
jgi:ATP-dependent DNA helicase RecQ